MRSSHPLLQDTEHFPSALLYSLGFEEVSAQDGRAEVRFRPRAAFTHSGGGTVQGGYVTAFLDNAMAFAAASAHGQPRLATLEMKVSFMGRVGIDRVIAVAWVRKLGRSVAFMEAELRDERGGVLACASSTCKVLSEPASSRDAAG
ncbi:PaaI family thioesterase [Xenophilus azovorans]|uniref:PaaI family thioesterase n=1 Tax=Xenophilus azovorans TaxID=151755 RepID=UPI000689958A|nr:PaaI family thioesterase [Xenophilus azovorans]